MPAAAPPRVFISYSHDSPVHMNRVLELSDRLRAEGIDCQIDQYEQSPLEGWPTWCLNQVIESEFVLVICTETYERRFRNREETGKGKGVTFEGYVIVQSLYNKQSRNDKFIPVIFSSIDSPFVPIPLGGASIYNLSAPEIYEQLYRRLTNQPFITRPVLGQQKSMMTRSTASSASLPRLERKQEFLTPVWSVPLPPNVFFTARESTLEEVHKKLLSSKRVALSGMRGVGKTRTAVEYVYRHRDHYLAILWARAETRDTLTGDFAAIARLLDLAQKDEKDQSIVVAAVKSWLESNNNWLLVLDNVDDLALVREFIPLTHPGRILLTTTAQASGQVAEKIKVEEMTEEEGALLLLRRAKVITSQAPFSEASPADQKNARQLAKELGGLPLALDQAGAFIEETPSTLAEYLELYKKEGKRLRKERGEFSGDHPSVSVTFSLAFAELAKRDSIAADLVRLCAFLAPDAIPEEIFAKGSTDLGEEFKKRVANPLDFTETVKQAAKFSLIHRDAQDRSLDIHRLVQEVLKDEMNVEQRRVWAECAVRAVNATLPEIDFRNWPDCERLLPHIQVCRVLIEEFSFEFQQAGHLLYQTAHYLTERGQYGGIEPIYRHALAICEKALSPEDSTIAKILNDLALLYRRLERYDEAEPLYKRSVEIYEKDLGPDHPYVATCLDNLARLYDIQGRYADAELLNKRSQAIFEKALKPDHPNIANNLTNLAMLYHHQGRYADAEPLYQRALTIRTKEFGPDHPTVATSLNNLATNYHDQERYDEAEQFYQRALTIYEKALGPNHPYIAVALGSYAALLRKTGRNAEAEPLEVRVQAIRAKQQAQKNPEAT